MPEVHPEAYSNPIAPPEQEQTAADAKKAKLTNDDFRKLLMTPRPTPSASTQTAAVSKPSSVSQKKESHTTDDDKRQKKKSLYSQSKKEEVERQAEWAKKYRDRAQERRFGKNPDYAASDDVATSTTGYKAVAPNVDQLVVEQRRKQAIQESKFLGGDIQHTHLVKGLDYVLLNKVRSEISTKHHEVEELSLLEKKRERERPRVAEFTDDLKFRTTMAKNVYRTLFLSKPPQRNELFAPRRMAYVFDLDDEYSESDIPTTLIRSLADCPTQESTTLTTNDIVISKLTQILSYLRQGSRSGRKAKRKERAMHIAKEEPPLRVPPAKKNPVVSERIFDELEEYVFDPSSRTAGDSSKGKRGDYFNKQADQEEESSKDIRESTEEFLRSVNKKYGDNTKVDETKEASKPAANSSSNKAGGSTKKNTKQDKAGFGGFGLEGHYAECYPGGFEEFDGNYDSDEDADYTKMDMGNKKGPVKRWDFENEEDYSNYQSEREALPKAAFQYGVKMSEGRKTRRFGGGMTAKAKEKAKLNREWQQISAILEKRKGGGGKSAAKRAKLEDD